MRQHLHPARPHDAPRGRRPRHRGARRAQRDPRRLDRDLHRRGSTFAGAYGHRDLATRAPATPETSYLWFSLTKVVTATAVRMLTDEGRLGLDDPAADHVPGLRGLRPGPTVRQLLNHTAGFSNPLPIRWVRADAAHDSPTDDLLERLLAKHGRPTHPIGGPRPLLEPRVPHPRRGHRGGRRRAVPPLRPAGHPAAARHGPHRLRPHPPGSRRHRIREGATLGHTDPPGRAARRDRRSAHRGPVGPEPLHRARPELRRPHRTGHRRGPVRGHAPQRRRARRSSHPPARDRRRHAPHQRPRATPRLRQRLVRQRQAPRRATTRYVEHLGAGGGFYNAMRIYPDIGIGIVLMTNTTKAYDHHQLFSQLIELESGAVRRRPPERRRRRVRQRRCAGPRRTGSIAAATSAGRSSWLNSPAPSMTLRVASGKVADHRAGPLDREELVLLAPDEPHRHVDALGGCSPRSSTCRWSKLRSTRMAASRRAGSRWIGWRKNSSNSPSSSDRSANASPSTKPVAPEPRLPDDPAEGSAEARQVPDRRGTSGTAS